MIYSVDHNFHLVDRQVFAYEDHHQVAEIE